MSSRTRRPKTSISNCPTWQKRISRNIAPSSCGKRTKRNVPGNLNLFDAWLILYKYVSIIYRNPCCRDIYAWEWKQTSSKIFLVKIGNCANSLNTDGYSSFLNFTLMAGQAFLHFPMYIRFLCSFWSKPIFSDLVHVTGLILHILIVWNSCRSFTLFI